MEFKLAPNGRPHLARCHGCRAAVAVTTHCEAAGVEALCQVFPLGSARNDDSASARGKRTKTGTAQSHHTSVGQPLF